MVDAIVLGDIIGLDHHPVANTLDVMATGGRTHTLDLGNGSGLFAAAVRRGAMVDGAVLAPDPQDVAPVIIHRHYQR
jgi:hypothetical protein